MEFRTAAEEQLDGLSDHDVLESAAQHGRVLVTHDIRTMPRHFEEFLLGGGGSPGVFLIPQRVAVFVALEELLMIWLASEDSEWRDRLIWLPL